MFGKEIEYQLADGGEVEESFRPPACTFVVEAYKSICFKRKTFVMHVLLLLSCAVNVGFAVDKAIQWTTQISPKSKYGEWLHEIIDPTDAV